MSVAVQCPTCGAPIEFRVDSSIVTVCGHCHAAVARSDRGLEDIGKVADLTVTTSPLQLWTEGSYKGVGFQLVGRAQLRHGLGGVWDEWYLAFDDSRWGWLAEAQGKFYLTFKIEGSGAPPYDSMVPGHTTSAGGGAVTFTVSERGESELLSGDGEMPYRLEPGSRARFADLVGAAGEFATIDYGDDPPTIYVGNEVSLADLGMDKAELREAVLPQVGSLAIKCPNCSGALELAAPDKAQRVICQYCDSILDATQGNLTLLGALGMPKMEPYIPLGAEGRFEKRRFKLIGFMQKSVSYSGTKYYWEEYLLYNPRAGFRWLTRADGHWSYVEPVNIATVKVDAGTHQGALAVCDGRSHTIFQNTIATVEYVLGEFYWKVALGQTTQNTDYIAPPYMLSREATANEATWSRATYLTHAELDAAFAENEIVETATRTVGANQPYPHSGIYLYWAIFTGLAILLILGVKARQADEEVLNQRVVLASQQSPDKSEVVFSEPFILKAHQNIVVKVMAPVSNSWVYLECDLVNVDSGKVAQFTMPIEYYFGRSGGENWSEGSRRKTMYMSAMEGGEYILRIAAQRKAYRAPMFLEVTVRQGVLRARYWITLLFLISLLPIAVFIHHRIFEKRRWSESDYGASNDDEHYSDDYYDLDDYDLDD